MPIARISYNFAEQLKKVQEVLSDYLSRTVTIPEITEKILLKVLIKNKAYKIQDRNIPEWEVAPIILVITGIRRYRNKKATLEILASNIRARPLIVNHVEPCNKNLNNIRPLK